MCVKSGNSRALITGASGYFGAIASDYFREQSWKVLKGTNDKSHDVWIDLDDPVKISKLRFREEIDVVIHAAASHEVTCRMDPIGSIMRNVGATKALLDCCVNNGVKKFIYISTFHVFGEPIGVINESAFPTPRDDYGMTHWQAEQYVEMYSRLGLIDSTSIRASNLFGLPSPSGEFNRWTLTPIAFCKEAICNRKIELCTPGYQKRNFLGIRDLCKLIEWVLENPHKHSLLHAPGLETISIRELAQRVKKVAKTRLGLDVELLVPKGRNGAMSWRFDSLFVEEFPRRYESLDDFLGEFMEKLHEGIV